MRTIAACLLIFASAVASARGLPEPKGVQVVVDIDATGHVTNATVAEELPKATQERLVQRVSAFEFTPATRDGRAVPCTTTLWLEFAFEAIDDDSVAIRIRDAYTGPGLMQRRGTKPGYPESMLRKRVDSDVSLELAYDADGKVTATKVLKSTGDASFGKASAMMASKWQMRPERIAGVGVPGKVLVPIHFRITNGRPPKLPAERGVQPVAEVDATDRELVAESEVALRTDVAGTLL